MGDVSNLIIFQKDVTMEQLRQKELNQAQKMDGIGRMSSGIAHDFKNIMAVISLSADYINILTENEEVIKEVNEIHDTISTGTSIIQKLLTFSKKTSETLVLFNPQDTITNFASILRRLITTRIGLELSHCTKKFEIKGLINSFEQVLLNLVVNSRDALPDGGNVKITTDIIEKTDMQFIIDEKSHLVGDIDDIFGPKKISSGKYFILQVSDDGIGIPKENHEKIFEPFFTTKFEGEGTGLGLSTVYGIIQDFSGYIDLSSVVNEGTTFHILIPAILK
jgi:two-component system cell cycle sensor histidine kinase/response regulator CckA